jgi:hypothetical protein
VADDEDVPEYLDGYYPPDEDLDDDGLDDDGLDDDDDLNDQGGDDLDDLDDFNLGGEGINDYIDRRLKSLDAIDHDAIETWPRMWANWLLKGHFSRCRWNAGHSLRRCGGWSRSKRCGQGQHAALR